MTPNQVSWASDHDWFISSKGVAWLTVTVRDWNNQGVMFVREFTGFKALKDWAGY